MKSLFILLLVLSLNTWGKPKASDFQEVFSEDEATESEESPAESPKVTLKENEAVLSGSVRVMRKIDRTEVFFKDLKDSFTIPSGSNYGALYSAFVQSQKTGQPVSFKANTKSRQIISLEGANSKNKDKSGSK